MKKLLVFAACMAVGSVYADGIQIGDNNTNTNRNTNFNLNSNANRNSNDNFNSNANFNRNSVNNRVDVHNSVKNVNFIDNSNRNKQGQLQGQAQKQGQYQGQNQSVENSQSQSADNLGNHQYVNFEDVRQAPAIGGPASGPCTGFSGGLSLGGSLAGAINFAKTDEECSKREAARVAHMLGAKDIAYKVLMSLDAVKAVMEDSQKKVEGRVSRSEKTATFSAGGDTF